MTRSSILFSTLIATAAGLAPAAPGAFAQAAMPAATQDDAAPLSVGEVKKVDKDTGKLTIRHGPLKNLDMPGMTMAFKVSDPAMLDKAKAGDPIRFHVERVNGTLTVTRLETADQAAATH
ncbi:copper-binding protein [Massilia putida]|uniref:copper-binding protein n=1 Tax=Massilia putida TaxID=1141883 RepID=UPI000952031F|nr:copper-binding protein [Massilia putida]